MIVHAYSDIFVKYLFGSAGHEDLLLRFINDVLGHSGSTRIASVDILNPFNLQTFPKDKLTILDVKGKDNKGKIYNIEIQSSGDETYKHRALYYWAKLYSSQIKEGEHYTKLHPVISINLLHFHLIKEHNDYYSCFRLTKNDDHDLVLTNHLSIYFIELLNFTKKIPKNLNSLEKWLYFFKYEGKEDEFMKVIIKDDEILEKADRLYKRFTQDEQLKDIYESIVEGERKYLTDLELAERKGIEQGIEKERHEIAQLMLKQGLEIDLISKTTQLTVEEIEQLK
ncbi:MAG TPA: Rpn family recombination-promoting nuclease/putative transposase [Spirochaetes bacterium]|nr:Rpn family recombination-promoting nuclease/putative transposase [Spirochaetota bacterium]